MFISVRILLFFSSKTFCFERKIIKISIFFLLSLSKLKHFFAVYAYIYINKWLIYRHYIVFILNKKKVNRKWGRMEMDSLSRFLIKKAQFKNTRDHFIKQTFPFSLSVSRYFFLIFLYNLWSSKTAKWPLESNIRLRNWPVVKFAVNIIRKRSLNEFSTWIWCIVRAEIINEELYEWNDQTP